LEVNSSASIPPTRGNVIELRECVFLFKAKPEGLTEYSLGRQPWDKDLIIFLALKGRYIILIQRHCPQRNCYYVNGEFRISFPLMGEGKGEGESIIMEEIIL